MTVARTSNTNQSLQSFLHIMQLAGSCFHAAMIFVIINALRSSFELKTHLPYLRSREQVSDSVSAEELISCF